MTTLSGTRLGEWLTARKVSLTDPARTLALSANPTIQQGDRRSGSGWVFLVRLLVLLIAGVFTRAQAQAAEELPIVDGLIAPPGSSPSAIRLPSGQPLKSGDVLLRRESVRTGDSTYLQIFFPPGALVSLGPDSEMMVSELEPLNSSVELKSGQIRAVLTARYGIRGVRVENKLATGAAKGTDFLMLTLEDGGLELQVYEGAVALAPTKGSGCTVDAGQRARVNADGTLGPAEKIPEGENRESDSLPSANRVREVLPSELPPFETSLGSIFDRPPVRSNPAGQDITIIPTSNVAFP